jgi:hypothetical protein
VSSSIQPDRASWSVEPISPKNVRLGSEAEEHVEAFSVRLGEQRPIVAALI